jgi:Phage integrase, N-terminal SAM-like domain
MNTEPLTDTNRLAYTLAHEAQESSSSSSWPEGWPCSDARHDNRATEEPGPLGSDCALEEGEGKERVTVGRKMTRSSFQKGYVFPRKTERGTVYVVRYRVRSADGTWRHKAETIPSPRRKDAEKVLAERLREVNRGLRLPVETTFAEFAADHWETYISHNLKPSTQASHRSNVRTHLLPQFGKLRLSEIGPLQIMDFLKSRSAYLD